MRKPIEDKSPLAAWATLSRESAGMSVEEVVAELGRRGHAVTAATIRGIEGGSKGASARLRRLLAAVYDVKVPGDAPEATQTPDALIQALMDQTKAIAEQTRVMAELVSELRAAHEVTPEVRERVAALEAYADEHERRLQADRRLMGLERAEDPPTRSPLPVASRS